MLECFIEGKDNLATPLVFMQTDKLTEWLEKQSQHTRNWVKATGFRAKTDSFCLVPDEMHKIAMVLVGCADLTELWNAGSLPGLLPAGHYRIGQALEASIIANIVLAWGLGAYQFKRYKQPSRAIAKLVLPEKLPTAAIISAINSIYLVRDLINTPTEDLGPAQLAQAAQSLAAEFNAEFQQIVGDDLLSQNFPLIHMVGRASAQAPRLLDIRWGNAADPKLTLVGKGVCFDSGGLDIKPSTGMLLMKKDMGGAAHVLGLARLIMAARLPVNLRVLIPAVENAISGNAFRPGDIVKSRQGLTIEIGNTDAEGRLILADALAEAASEQPDLIIDFATLTGAARVALGTDLPAFFTADSVLAQQLANDAETVQDPLWRLPLYKPYRQLLDSAIADINNAGSSGYAGAITAALFLKEFIPAQQQWLHVDLMAWNLNARPGRPEGGEAMGLRAVFAFIQQRYQGVL